MTNNAHKEKWIDEVLSSTTCMARATPGDGFFGGITTRLQQPAGKVIAIPIKQWAAAAIILLALNIGSVIYYSGHNKVADAATQGNPLASEMQLQTTYNY